MRPTKFIEVRPGSSEGLIYRPIYFIKQHEIGQHKAWNKMKNKNITVGKLGFFPGGLYIYCPIYLIG